jgi:hypothetical protein
MSLPAGSDITQRLCLDGLQKTLKQTLPGSDKKRMRELPPTDQPDAVWVGLVGPPPWPTSPCGRDRTPPAGRSRILRRQSSNRVTVRTALSSRSRREMARTIGYLCRSLDETWMGRSHASASLVRPLTLDAHALGHGHREG